MSNYLYNGVPLPALPEWDRESYPYAVIYWNSTGARYQFGASAVPIEPREYGSASGFGLYVPLVYTILTDGVWGELTFKDTESLFLWPLTVSFVWTNTDILNSDGSVYLSATTPISLANQTVIEWDGDTTDLESTTRSFTVSENTETLTFYKVSDAVPSVKQVEGGYYVTYYYNAGTRYDGKNINYLTSDGFVVSGGTDDTFCNPFVLVNSDGVWLSKTEYADNADGDHYTSVATYATVVADIDPVAFMTGWQLGKAIRSLLK